MSEHKASEPTAPENDITAMRQALHLARDVLVNYWKVWGPPHERTDEAVCAIDKALRPANRPPLSIGSSRRRRQQA